eukprot:CAMPEP_0172457590 /NCGR_PEP_ID=MMETSP1065-20121228/22980_1 /TAXON_ID=265537 /ORGANISM="Amphiprora paludosa, Strain CCMP125" /LENGTH=238 /DNA_ID=CAMNT_0013211419 /DNA_START=16 /DNA_END=732 /DNA_ORIENTATION=+
MMTMMMKPRIGAAAATMLGNTRLFVMALLLCLPFCQASMIVQVAPGRQECYFVRVPNHQPAVVSGNYDVLDDDVDDDAVSAWLEKRTAKRKGVIVWRTEEHEGEDTFSLTVDAEGKYAFCVRVENFNDNDDAMPDRLQIGFSLRVSPLPRSLEDGVLGPDAERALELVQTAGFVENDWRNFMDHFDYLRSREVTHTALMHQIRDRVLGWTVVEAMLVITMAVAQILYWRRFFETRRFL